MSISANIAALIYRTKKILKQSTETPGNVQIMKGVGVGKKPLLLTILILRFFFKMLIWFVNRELEYSLILLQPITDKHWYFCPVKSGFLLVYQIGLICKLTNSSKQTGFVFAEKLYYKSRIYSCSLLTCYVKQLKDKIRTVPKLTMLQPLDNAAWLLPKT